MKKISIFLITIISLNSDTIDFTNSINPRDVSVNPVVYGHADPSYTTSVIGLSLYKVSDANGGLVTGTVSQLVLNNSNITLDGDYSFTYSSLRVVGDVSINGCGNTFKFFGNHLLIDSGSTLRIGDDTTFDYTPSSSSNSAISLLDCDSVLFLDNATLNIDNGEVNGLRLKNGKLVVDGQSTISLASTDTKNALILGGGVESDCDLVLKSASNLNITNGSVISDNRNASSFNIADDASITGNFYFKNVPDNSGGSQTFDLLKNIINFDIDRLDGVSLSGRITGFTEVFTSTGVSGVGDAKGVSFSPNGKYLAVISDVRALPNNHEFAVYSFDGSSLTLLDTAQYITDEDAFKVEWCPDGRHIAICGNGTGGGSELQVFRFENNALTLVSSIDSGSDNMFSLRWSRDGRFLAGGAASNPGGAFNNNEFAIFSFDGFILSLVASFNFGGGSSALRDIAWSPDSQFVSICGLDPTGSVENNELAILKFDGSSLAFVTGATSGDRFLTTDWSPNGKFIATGGGTGGDAVDELAVFSFDGGSLNLIDSASYSSASERIRFLRWSPDSKYIAFGGQDSPAGGDFNQSELGIVEFTGSNIITSTFVLAGVGISGIDWSPDGNFLAASVDDSSGGIFNENEINVLGLSRESITAKSNIENFAINSDAIIKDQTVVKSL